MYVRTDVVCVSLHLNVHGDSCASTLVIYFTKLEILEVALSGEDAVRLNVMDKDLKSMGFSCTFRSPHSPYYKSIMLMVLFEKPIFLKSF